MKQIVFASGNTGKTRELKELLEPLNLDVIAQSSLAIDPVEETGLTFVENAILKARNACVHSGLPAMADDSGLSVDALNGAPGLYSARYAEMHDQGQGDVDNYNYLLKQLEKIEDPYRSANFITAIVYLRHAEDPCPIIAQGFWKGHILKQASGNNGFGYDPVFCNHDTMTAVSELDSHTKNQFSHRGKAVRQLLSQLKDES